MDLFFLIITLLSLATSALCSLERLAHLPDCTTSTAGLSVCGSAPSYTNDIFQCTNNLRWDLVHTCTSPNAPCSNATCTPLPSRCEESTTQCATLHTHGYDGISVCQDGKWEMRDSCACGDDGGRGPQCVERGGKAKVLALAKARACKKGELVCLAENEEGKDGAVFRCNEMGMWRIVQDCSRWERCVEKPTPHCRWD